MQTIHIFNPDTDYALASGLDFYTPPASVITLRREMALLPALWAKPGDAILLLDDLDPTTTLDYLDSGTIPDKARLISGLQIYRPEDTLSPIADFQPWGWNRDLRRRLIAAGADPCCLPSVEYIDCLRDLSHRRTTIPFNKAIQVVGTAPLHRRLPVELNSVDDVLAWLDDNPGAWLKAPWSSSGRGVLRTSDLETRHVRPWAHGIIRRQGSVMAEHGVARALDFATEWHCDGGKARFLGLSVFETSPRGKYQSNLRLSQEALEKRIMEVAPSWSETILKAQKDALESIIAPHYSGPLGIDMMVDNEGLVYPCVEINLRRTMGMI